MNSAYQTTTLPSTTSAREPNRRLIGIFCYGISCAFLIGCTAAEQITRFGGSTMGTTYQVTYASTGAPVPEEIRGVEELLAEINDSLSTYIETSLISRVNRSVDTEGWNPIDTHFETVFRRSREIHLETDGAFNPAVGPLVEAWGFGPEGPGKIPDAATITSLLESTSLDAFEIRTAPPGLRKRDARARLDFSAIAKGYAVDAVAMRLEAWGVTEYFVEIGGEVRTRGAHPTGRSWRIGIERPAENATVRGTIQTSVPLRDGALATSGNYRNYRVEDGREIVHILNPATGRPEVGSLLSISVLAEDVMSADAYATAFMVMGIDRALRFVEEKPGVEAYFIVSDAAGGIVETRSLGFPEPPED